MMLCTIIWRSKSEMISGPGSAGKVSKTTFCGSSGEMSVEANEDRISEQENLYHCASRFDSPNQSSCSSCKRFRPISLILVE